MNLFIMDMTNAGNTSGVDRYLEMLTRGLQRVPYIRLHRIQLIEGGNRLFVRRTPVPQGGVTVQIPLPRCMSEVLTQSFWTRKYNEQVYRLTRDLFEGKERIILHLHTLNLIDLACYIREQVTADCRFLGETWFRCGLSVISRTQLPLPVSGGRKNFINRLRTAALPWLKPKTFLIIISTTAANLKT